jgi:hypothetical protein
MDIESQPAIAGDSIKPGVKRSGTPGDCPKIMPARGARDSVYRDPGLSPATAGWWSFGLQFLGFRYASPQALCYRPLPRASLDFVAE